MSSYPPIPPPVRLPPQPAPENVQARALKRLQLLVKGNGLKPEDVTIAENEAKLICFPARCTVRLVTSYTSRTEAGQVNKGEIIHSPAAFTAALSAMVKDARHDSGKRQAVLDAIAARTDKGFGAKDQSLVFDKLARDFSSQEACGNCGQSGKITCNTCGGKAVMTCGNCQGRRNTMCPQCRGSGRIRQNNNQAPNQTTPCPRCRGAARVPCPACQARGSVPCRTCSASGQMRCGQCSGTGFLSHLAHVILQGHLHFNFERQGMPVELSKMIDAFGARHAAKKDLEVRVLAYDGTHAENAAENTDTMMIDYDVRVPYGTLTFNLKGKPVQATMFGWRGTLLKAPDFLDELTRKGQKNLELAAAGKGDVGEKLRQAADYRLLRDVIILAAAKRHSAADRRIALSKLLGKYPVGMSADKLLHLLTQAGQAIASITRKPRLFGLLAGLAIFAALETVYFLPIVRGHLHPASLRLLADLAQIGLGTLLGWAGSYFLARHRLETALQGLASPGTIKRNSPKFDNLIWAAFALALLVTGGFYFLGGR